MDDEMEEGELADSDSDDGRNILSSLCPEPVPVTGMRAVKTDSARFDTGPRKPPPDVTRAAGDAFYCQKPVSRLRSGSSESDSDSKHSDSDDEYEPAAKKITSNNLMNSSLHKQQTVPVCRATAGNKYNIWGAVLEEQTLSKDLSGWSGVKKKLDSDRDVEAYDYETAKNDVRLHSAVAEEESLPSAEEPFDGSVIDTCDKETFGTSAGKLVSKNKAISSSSVDADNTMDCGDANKRAQRKRSRETSEVGSKPGALKRLGERTYDKTKDRSHVRVKSSDSPAEIGEELVRLLQEPEHMKETFERVADTVGGEKALELLYCTEDLEAAGGLMTLDGKRRRTPGGVYLHLLKVDNAVTKKQYGVIFKEQIETKKRHQKEAKKWRWKQRFQSSEADTAGEDTSVDHPLPDCKELFLNNALGHRSVEVPSPVTSTLPAAENSFDDELAFDGSELVDIELDVG